MDKPIERHGRLEGKVRGDMKVAKDGKVRPRRLVKQDITKEQFLANLGKVCRPIGKESTESDSEKTQT